MKKTKESSLKAKQEFPLFKTWVFEWAEWKKGAIALKVCKSFSALPSLEYCEPDYLLGPAGFLKRKRETVVAQEPKDKGHKKIDPPPVVKTRTGNLKTCNIVPSQLKLYEGRLSDYWAQEMIGSDLLKEEWQKAPPVKKHLVAVFDSPREGHNRHDIGVKNLISDTGRHAVLPDIGNSMTNFDASQSSFYLQHSSYLLNQARNKCQ